MKEIGDHFIEKISVDIYSKSVENAKSIEQNIDAFITEYIIPSVEKYLDELEKELHYASIQIPNISISLDLMEEDFSDLKFVQQAFINQFKKQSPPMPKMSSKVNRMVIPCNKVGWRNLCQKLVVKET